MVKTIPDVFIIESLAFDDEDDDMYEGRMLSDILKLNGKTPIYYYIRTKQELYEVIDKFEDSNYRYLHISCHGSRNSMETTLDSISFDDLEKIISPCLDYKRLFFSACNMVNSSLARKMLVGTKCHSLIGPFEPVNFSDAAIFWASFYHLMFAQNENSMKLKDIRASLKNLSNLFGVPVNYYSTSKDNKQGFSYRKVSASRSSNTQ